MIVCMCKSVCVCSCLYGCVCSCLYGCVCVCVYACVHVPHGRAGKNWRGRGWSLHLRVNEAPLPREGGSWPGLLCGLESWSLSLTRARQSGWEGCHTGPSELLAVCDMSGRSVGEGAGQGLELPACCDLSQPLPLVSLSLLPCLGVPSRAAQPCHPSLSEEQVQPCCGWSQV